MLTSGRVAWRGKLQSKAKILKGSLQHAACLNYNGPISRRIKRGLFFVEKGPVDSTWQALTG